MEHMLMESKFLIMNLKKLISETKLNLETQRNLLYLKVKLNIHKLIKF